MSQNEHTNLEDLEHTDSAIDIEKSLEECNNYFDMFCYLGRLRNSALISQREYHAFSFKARELYLRRVYKC
jgi:hypothetical protein